MLGKGGFGKVFTAVRKSDCLEVAVKEVVKDSRYKSDSINNNFPAEISLMEQVQMWKESLKFWIVLILQSVTTLSW